MGFSRHTTVDLNQIVVTVPTKSTIFMDLPPPKRSEVLYLTFDELKEWAAELAHRYFHGEDTPELARSAQVALKHPEAANLPSRIKNALQALNRMTIPVCHGSSGIVKPRLRIVRTSVADQVRAAVALNPQDSCPPHVPGFRSSNSMWGIDRRPVDRVAGRCVRK